MSDVVVVVVDAIVVVVVVCLDVFVILGAARAVLVVDVEVL